MSTKVRRSAAAHSTGEALQPFETRDGKKESIRGRRSCRIILVDDDHQVLKALARQIEGLGHQSIPIEDAREALQAYKKEGADLVMTDFEMPDMDGLQLLKAIREYDPDAVVIIITGNHEIDSQMLLDAGARDVLHKPFEMEELAAAIERNLPKG